MTNHKNSLSWQLYQLQQRFDEWWEVNTWQWGENIPDVDLFSWLDNQLAEITARVLFWVIVAFLLSWIAIQLVRLLTKYSYALKNRYNRSIIETRPRAIPTLSVNNWLKQAHYFQQQGNYREAIWSLYMAMLQKLHDTGVAPHQLSRTDGEYLQIIQQLPHFMPYQTLLITHQQLLFGNQEASPAMWEQCQQAYGQIEQTK
jgi:hypothetical protein